MIGLLCTPLFSIFIPHVRGQETVIFQDDFESYAIGSFPSSGGWQIVWNGAGNQYQVITNSYSHSPSKSLQLVGSYGWSVVVKKDFSTNASVIGYEASLMSTNIAGGGGISFFNRPIDTWGRFYAGVGFLDGYIESGSVKFQPFTPYTWYKIRVVLDKITRKYDVWIDDALVGKDLVEPNDPNEILSLHIGVGWKQVAHYFDDIKVFSVTSSFDALITPAEITTSIGGAVNYDITLRNYQETSCSLTLSVADLDPSWFSLEKNKINLAPGEVTKVRVDIVVPENPSAVGAHPFSVTVFDGFVQKILVANLVAVLDLMMYDLEPKDDTTIGSTDVVISWRTSSSASSEVYIKRADESAFTRWDGEHGLEHLVHIYNLSRNTDCLWYAYSSTPYSNVTSEIRNLHVANGLSFTQDVYTFYVERDYAQKVGISVINTDNQPHDLLLKITNPYEDLIVGFVGAGSVDQTVSVSPNEARIADLYIHAQDAKLSAYTLKINLTNLGAEEIMDYAVVIVNVRQPNINLEVLEISMDNVTLAKTYTIINHGDTITDLQVLPEESLKNRVEIDPNINHALLRTGESLSFRAMPVLTRDFTGYYGNIQVVTAGETQNVSYTAALPQGKQVFLVVLEDRTWSVAFNDWYCTNRPSIDERFTLPSYIKKTVDGIPNVDRACVKAYFSLAWPRDTYRPHNVHLLMNGVEIGSLTNTVPEGSYLFQFDGYLLNYASEGLAENVLTLQMDNLNGGHYVVWANMEIVLHVKKIEIAVVASNITEAETLAEKLGGTIADFADFAVCPEGITLSNSQPNEGETITISAKIFNFGTLQGSNVPISFYLNSTLVETKTILVIPSLSVQIVGFEWTTTKGTHTITIKINEGQTIVEKDYSDNQASKSLKVMSISPEVEAYLVDVMWEFLVQDEDGDRAVEKGATITVYFEVRARMSSSTMPVNGIEVNIATSSDSSAKSYISEQFNGKDGIIQVGPYETLNYDGSKFFVRVIDGSFYGIPVVSNNLVIGYIIKPRTSVSGVGFESSASAALDLEAVPIGIGFEDELSSSLEFKNDGTNILEVLTSQTAKLGASVSIGTPGFSIAFGGLRAEAGVGLETSAGLSGGFDCSFLNPSQPTQTSSICYAVALSMLNYAEAQVVLKGNVAAKLAIEAAKTWINSKLSELGIELHCSPICAGGYFKVEIDADARLQAESPLLTAIGNVNPNPYGIETNQFKAALISAGGGVSGSFEISAELRIYGDVIGVRMSANAQDYLGYDLGFASFTGQNLGFEIAVELDFDKSTQNLKNVVYEFSIELTKEMYAQSQFGGLLKWVKMADLVFAPSKTYKITTTYNMPVTNAGTLSDYLKATGLAAISPALGMLNIVELGQKIADSAKNQPIEYCTTLEEKATKSFPIELELGSGFSFNFQYIQSQSCQSGRGYVTFDNGQLVFWPVAKYVEIPQRMDVESIVLNDLIDAVRSILGTTIQMVEPQSKLYLHVYDMASNHVGFNSAKNTTDVNIPGSSYFDNLYGKTEIVLPSDLKSFRVIVDGTYAHYDREKYSLRICRFGAENHTAFQFEGQEIAKGTSRDYLVTILNDDKIIVNEILKLSVSVSPLSASTLLGQSVTFTSTVSGGYTPYSYQWYLNGNPVSGATSNTWVFTPTTSGIYYVYLKVTDSKADTAQSETARIVVTSVPVGGYSILIQEPATAKPLMPYLIFTAILSIAFTAIKRKTARKPKHQ